jgi:uncharacterized protein YvpB
MAVLFIFAGITTLYLDSKKHEESQEAVLPEEEVKEVVREEKETEVLVKESAYIEIPYTVQAPNQSWSIHDESCEEAAALMYYYFLKKDKRKDIPADEASQKILRMVAWQKTNYGKEPDLSIAAFGKFFNSYYGYKYKIKSATIDEIKKVVSGGSPVIVPVMTHSLGNPYYGRENSYHLLLIKGYDKKGVITNDAGVTKGKNYRYTWEVLFKAIDAQKTKMNQGRLLIYFY